jgi:hypothetical protein
MPEEKSDELEQGVVLPSMPGGDPYSESGVDRTLIWWMLSLTPAQRLEALTRFVESLQRMRGDRPPT